MIVGHIAVLHFQCLILQLWHFLNTVYCRIRNAVGRHVINLDERPFEYLPKTTIDVAQYRMVNTSPSLHEPSGEKLSLELTFHNFRVSDFSQDFEEELPFFSYSEILKNRLQGHFLNGGFTCFQSPTPLKWHLVDKCLSPKQKRRYWAAVGPMAISKYLGSSSETELALRATITQ